MRTLRTILSVLFILSSLMGYVVPAQAAGSPVQDGVEGEEFITFFGSEQAQTNDPPGNNGHVFINGLALDGLQEAHLSDPVEIEAIGFDSGQEIGWGFELINPTTGDVELPSGTLVLNEDGYGKVVVQLCEVLNKSGVEPHPQQGFHLGLNVDTNEPGGKKSKNVWVECAPPPPPPEEFEFVADDRGNCERVEIEATYVKGPQSEVDWEASIEANGTQVASGSGTISKGEKALLRWIPDLADLPGASFIDHDFTGFIRIFDEEGETVFERILTPGAHLTCKVEVEVNCDGALYKWIVDGDPILSFEQSDEQEGSFSVSASDEKLVPWEPPIQGKYGPFDVSASAELKNGDNLLAVASVEDTLTCGNPPIEPEFTGDDAGSCEEVWMNVHYLDNGAEGPVYWEGQFSYNDQVVASNSGTINPGDYAFLGWNPDINDVGGDYIDGDFTGYIRVYDEQGGNLLFERNMTPGAHLTCKVEVELDCQGVTYSWIVEGDPLFVWEQSDGQSGQMAVNASGEKFVAWEPPIDGQYGPFDVSASAELKNGDNLLAVASVEDTLTCGPAEAGINVDVTCDGVTVSGSTDVATVVSWTFGDESGSQDVDAGDFSFTAGTPLTTYGPHDLSGSAEMVVEGKTYSDSAILEGAICGPELEEGACVAALGDLTWQGNMLMASGTIEGRNSDMWAIMLKGEGPPEGNAKNDPSVLDWGRGRSGNWDFTREWENRSDVKNHYQGWVHTERGWITSPKCEFKPILSCPDCGPHVDEVFGDNASTPELQDGDQLVFWADECTVAPCNTLTLTTQVLYRSIGDNFQIPYKGEVITGDPVSRVPGDLYVTMFPSTWLQDGQDFVLLDEKGEPVRDKKSHGPDGVEKYIACSLSVGLVDIDCDAMAYYTKPQTIWDWQWAVIHEWKLLDNSQDSWDQVYDWAVKLRDEGELSLHDIDNFGDKSLDTSALEQLLAPCPNN
jgi:hypothetical protein